jgi:hypothetical protein
MAGTMEKTMDDQECRYSDSLLKTSQALAIAAGGLAFAVQAIESGTPASYAIGILKKDIATIKDLMG